MTKDRMMTFLQPTSVTIPATNIKRCYPHSSLCRTVIEMHDGATLVVEDAASVVSEKIFAALTGKKAKG